MPIKTPCDLSEDEFVYYHESRLRNGEALEVTIRIQPKPTQQLSIAGKSLDELREMGIICTAKDALADRDSNRATFSQIKVSTGIDAWRVVRSDSSEAGWGPFLYDIAMELATLANAGLCSHESSMSNDAMRVWDFYFSHRDDVTKTKLVGMTIPNSSNESLHFSYRKSPPRMIEELKYRQKWIERYSICEEE